MIVKMTKKRGAKFKRLDYTSCMHEPFREVLQAPHYHDNYGNQSGPVNLVSSLSVSGRSFLGWARVTFFVIFIIECFILSLLINLPSCYGNLKDESVSAVKSSHSVQQQTIIPATVNLNQAHLSSVDVKQPPLRNQSTEGSVVTPNAGAISRKLSSHNWLSDKKVDRASSSSQGDGFVSKDNDSNDQALEARDQNYARASKQLKKLLARPRHILYSFVPNALTQQLIIKRPDNLMTIKLKRLHEKLHNNNQHSKNDKLGGGGNGSTRLQQLLSLSNNPELRPRPIGLPVLPNFLTMGALQVRPLILTTTTTNDHNDFLTTKVNEQMARPINNNNLQQSQYPPPIVESRKPELVIESDDHSVNTERELGHFDQLIKGEYEKRTNDDMFSDDGGNKTSILRFKFEGDSSKLQASVGLTDSSDTAAGVPLPAENRHLEPSFVRPTSDLRPVWRPADHRLMHTEISRGPAKRFNQLAANSTHLVTSSAYHSRPVRYPVRNLVPALHGIDNSMGRNYGRPLHRHEHYLGRNQVNPLSRLPSGSSNKPIIPMLSRQQQQAFMPTALETIAQLRLNSHYNNNGGDNTYNNNSSDFLTNGTRSSSLPHRGLNGQQTTYLKVPSLQASSHIALVPKPTNKPTLSSSSNLASHFQAIAEINPTEHLQHQNHLPRQQNLQHQQQEQLTHSQFHQNYQVPTPAQDTANRNGPVYLDDSAYLASPTTNLNLLHQHHNDDKVRKSDGNQNQPSDSIEQIVSSMTALSSSSNNNQNDHDDGVEDDEDDDNMSDHQMERKDSSLDSGQAAAVGGRSEMAYDENGGDLDNLDDDGRPNGLSETLRKLRETKARIRQLQAELNVSDPNLLLLGSIGPTNRNDSGAMKEDTWDERKFGGHDLGGGGNSTNGGNNNNAYRETFSDISSSIPYLSSDNTNQPARDWFSAWPRNSSDENNNNQQFANRSSLLKESLLGSHESMNLPLGMYHNGPLGAPARLVASAFGRAAKNTASSQMASGGSQWPMFNRPQVARIHGSAPVLVSSTMLVGSGSGDSITHTTTKPLVSPSMPAVGDGVDTTSTMATTELANDDRLVNSVNSFEETTAGQRLGSQFRPMNSVGGQLGESTIKLLGDDYHKGSFLTHSGAAKASTQAVISHNGFRPSFDTMNQTEQRLMAEMTTRGLSSSESANNSNQNGNHNKDRLSILDGANRTPQIIARYPNKHQQLSMDSLQQPQPINTTGIELLQRIRQLRDPNSSNNNSYAGGQQLQPVERKPSQQVNGSLATIGSSISSRIATSGSQNLEPQLLDSGSSFSSGGFNGKHVLVGQFSDSFDQESVNSINRLLAGNNPTTATNYAVDLSGQLAAGTDLTRDTDTTNGKHLANATVNSGSSGGNSISHLFSKLFQSLTFSSFSGINHNVPTDNSTAGQSTKQNLATTPNRGSTTMASIPIESKLTTEKVLHTLIAFSCSLAILCLLVVVATVRCQMRARKRGGGSGSRAALSIQSSIAEARSSSSSALSPGRDWRRGLGKLGSGDTRNQSDILILDGTMRNVSMLARHHNTDSKRLAKELRKPLNLPLPLFKRTCCHCVGCSESWLFKDSPSSSSSGKRSTPHTNLCSSGFYHPAPRGRLPFGAASSVNKFLNHSKAPEGAGMMSPNQPNASEVAAIAQQIFPTSPASDTAGLPEMMLKSPSVRGPIGGTRLRMMSAIEERNSPEPTGGRDMARRSRGDMFEPPLAECVCGHCMEPRANFPPSQEMDPTLAQQDACQSMDLETLAHVSCGQNHHRMAAIGGDGGDTMERHHQCSLLLEATNADCESCNCHGNNNAVDQRFPATNANPTSANYERNSKSTVPSDGGRVNIRDDAADDGLIGPTMDQANCNLINGSTVSRTKATTSAKTSATTYTKTIAANCERIEANGSSDPHCCKLCAKHGPNMNNGCCDKHQQQQTSKAEVAVSRVDNTTDVKYTSAKKVISRVDVKLHNQQGDLVTAHTSTTSSDHDDDGNCEPLVLATNQGYSIEEATSYLDARQQHKQQHHKLDDQRVSARIREFNGSQASASVQQANVGKTGEGLVGLQGGDELAGDAYNTCCPHDSSSSEFLNRNHHHPRLKSELTLRGDRGRATKAKLAAFASSPLSLAATIQGKLRKTMAAGGSIVTGVTTTNIATNLNAQQKLQQESIAKAGRVVNSKGMQQLKNQASIRELRIEVNPDESFDSDGLAAAVRLKKPKQPARG